MKKQDLIITIMFLCFLFLPNSIYFFVKDKMDNNNYENRTLYTKPSFEYKSISSFPRDYENYFNDHLAFKNEIRRFRSKVLYNLFKTSSSENVIIGDNNWLFYNITTPFGENSIADFQNITKYSNEEKEIIKDNLIATRDKLKNKNIDFYIFIIPNKENIYYDFMPKMINRNSNSKSRTEELVEYLNNESDLNIVYPKNELIENRKNDDTYMKNDTHWNSFGAYIGIVKLMEKVDPNINVGNLETVHIKSSGDLAHMNLMPNDLIATTVITKSFMDDITVSCTEEINSLMECNSTSPNNKKILFIGDSFKTLTIQYLSKLYTQTYFIHRDYYNEEIIKQYNPDIIIFEVVERHSFILNDFSLLSE